MVHESNGVERVVIREYPKPLNRLVTLEGDSVTLRDGLDRLAAAARVRLSYVAELLPLERRHCLAYRAVPAGQVLSDLLNGTTVEPVVAGGDQIVLAPTRRNTAVVPNGTVDMARQTSLLDRVVVTGTAESRPERADPTAVAVITREQIARQQSGSLSHILDGGVPGLWMWQASPTSLAARYGSIRGASSFGLTYPKIYIDGIEVANPLLVKQFDPSIIERVEIIRGPQGAALYGADAVSGVINIVTRMDGAAPGGQRLQLTSAAGVSSSAFASQDALTQQHGVTFRTGTAERSAGLALNVTTLGAFIPDAFARSIAGSGSFRIVGTRSVLSGTARLFGENAGSPPNPLLAAIPPNVSREPLNRAAHTGTGVAGVTRLAAQSPVATQSVRQYTLGTTLTVAPNDRWTHAAVIGVDGYRLRNPSVTDGPIPTPIDSALGAAQGGSDRLTARVTSTARFGVLETVAAALTFTAEHSAAREQSLITTTAVSSGSGVRPGDQVVQTRATLTGWRANSGVVAQANASLWNHAFLSAGLRLERIEGLIGISRIAALPMLGVALAGDRGDVSAKVRAAYGKAVRPVGGAIRELAWSGQRATYLAYDLAPEQQAGIEVGADLFIGRTLALHITRFDQRATDLIQSVAVAFPSSSMPGDGTGSHASAYGIAYQLQNVGEIGNRGWEVEGSAELGRLALGGSVSLVDSRVRRLGVGYTGDLRAGDRMLDVPARTATMTAAWTSRRWATSLSVSRAMDWTGYDRLALADSLTSGGLMPRGLIGAELRNYWREYDGVTRLRATFSRDLYPGLAFVMTGDNLFGTQRGEPDNVTVVPGRTITAGIRATF
ncbi:MAG: TonB-dependent receptor plug [Geminicoccaceae bacterium]|nr:TonB-dependent receptor plug [Geminicoccaceae bacterium]